MRRRTAGLMVAAAIAAVGTWSGVEEAAASDPFGVYALVDSAEVQTSGDGPATLRVTGLFAVASARFGGDYRSPRLGSVTMSPGAAAPERVKKQWDEIIAAAGTGKVVAFGSRHASDEIGVTPPGGTPEATIDTSGGMGVRVLDTAQYGPVAMLRSYPRIVGPLGDLPFDIHKRYGAMGRLQITVRNPVGAPAGYRLLFETERANGDIVGSGPVEPGAEGETTFEEWRFFSEGERVTFRVRAVHDELTHASVAVGAFRVVGKTEGE